jgi:hypothetical protein
MRCGGACLLHKTQTARKGAEIFGGVRQTYPFVRHRLNLNQGPLMELIEKSMSILFDQLGEPSDEAAIDHFIAMHGGLTGDTHLHEAAFWSASQASFLREALTLDSTWAPIVDELNTKLHQRP